MNTKCYDIGTIQAFLDGELSADNAAKITSHVALCDACAVALAEAEEESSVVFSALEREFNTLVPTLRLWSKINDSIEIEKQRLPFWQKVWIGLNALIAGPSLAIAAGLIIVFGISIAIMKSGTNFSAPVAVPGVDDGLRVGADKTNIVDPLPANPLPKETIVSSSRTERPTRPVVSRQPNTRVEPIKTSYTPDNASPKPAVERPSVNSAGYLPGEESYVKTIASLSQTVSGQEDTMMRPSERVSYERDMAVVDDAIARMRKEVRRNPKNESARQVLYTSYQNKIDLLNSVSQKEELIASLR